MKYKYISLILATLIPGGICLAQTNQTAVLEDFKPSSVNQPDKQYPQVNSEGRVRVSISAPQALKVQFDIGAVKYDLKKDDKGVWTGECAPQDEGFHYYQLWVDGASVPDPAVYTFMAQVVGAAAPPRARRRAPPTRGRKTGAASRASCRAPARSGAARRAAGLRVGGEAQPGEQTGTTGEVVDLGQFGHSSRRPAESIVATAAVALREPLRSALERGVEQLSVARWARRRRADPTVANQLPLPIPVRSSRGSQHRRTRLSVRARWSHVARNRSREVCSMTVIPTTATASEQARAQGPRARLQHHAGADARGDPQRRRAHRARRLRRLLHANPPHDLALRIVV